MPSAILLPDQHQVPLERPEYAPAETKSLPQGAERFRKEALASVSNEELLEFAQRLFKCTLR